MSDAPLDPARTDKGVATRRSLERTPWTLAFNTWSTPDDVPDNDEIAEEDAGETRHAPQPKKRERPAAGRSQQPMPRVEVALPLAPVVARSELLRQLEEARQLPSGERFRAEEAKASALIARQETKATLARQVCCAVGRRSRPRLRREMPRLRRAMQSCKRSRDSRSALVGQKGKRRHWRRRPSSK